MNHIVVKTYKSPIGPLLIGTLDGRLCVCDWQQSAHHALVLRRLSRMLRARCVEGYSPDNNRVTDLLDDYFYGAQRLPAIAMTPVGSEFQHAVWHEVLKIPFGATATYAEIAQRLGCPTSVRAVANAIGANALSIFIPCHRVIGTTRGLTGYAGGIDAKQYLLQLEADAVNAATADA